ncbi:MAG: DUF4364 family protein [Oscillospiraceae bacterium]|nr:DUF4364 family protein [Oscillospiraceae bacterium]
MDNLGFIRSKTEIKVLILYILSKLPRPVDINTLADLVLCDEGINYFDYSEALYRLVASGHVDADSEKYSITEKGAENIEATVDSLPFTVKTAAARQAERLAKILNRSAMVETSSVRQSDGSCRVNLSLSDGIGNIMKLDILAGSAEQAAEMEKKFKTAAEELYISIAGLLLE